MFTYSLDQISDQIHLALMGELDMSVRDQLTGLINQALAGHPTIVVDVAGVRFADCAIVGALVHARLAATLAATLAGLHLVLAHPCGIVARLLHLLGLTACLTSLPIPDRPHGVAA